jgi:hypothetical protein
MTQDQLTLYKLIVLYMLNKVSFPMTKAQVGDFILEREYTTFLTLQQAISELIDTRLITAESIRNRTHLVITEEGKNTLHYFENRISEAIKKDINGYFRENELELRNEVSVMSNFYKATNGEYEAHLIAKDKEIELVNIKLSVPSEDVAAAICENWQERNQEIYKLLITNLF